MNNSAPQLIGIAGGSCAGKSWLAEQLDVGLAKRAARLSLDNFYLDRSYLSPARRAMLNFDHPRAIDWRCFEETLFRCAKGEPFSVPGYDFATHSRSAQEFPQQPAPIVIVEGLWLFRRPTVRRLFSLKIFIRSSEQLCVNRRLARDSQERGRTEEQIRHQLDRYTLPMFSRFVAPQEKWADLILEAPVSAEDVSGLLNRIAGNLCAYGI